MFVCPGFPIYQTASTKMAQHWEVDPRTGYIKEMGPSASLLGTEHQGLDWLDKAYLYFMLRNKVWFKHT